MSQLVKREVVLDEKDVRESTDEVEFWNEDHAHYAVILSIKDWVAMGEPDELTVVIRPGRHI